MYVNSPNNLEINQIIIWEENGIYKIKDFKYLRRNYESMTFLYLPTMKEIV